MKPEAIFTAAAELVGQILSDPQPANDIINAYTRSRRYIGSKDRRTLTDLVWSYIRHQSRLNYLYPNQTIDQKLKKLSQIPEIIPDAPFHINMEVPKWLPPLIPDAPTELPVLLEFADTILRANGDRDQIRKQLALEGIETTPTPLSPYGLKLSKRANIQGTRTYRNGLIEIQDEASQCVALETAIKPGDKVLDYCAGAGGKSLIFAQMMQNKGIIVAHDISARSLAELQKRATRANASCIRVQHPLTATLFDHVVTDVPCSGTGTWRRCPDRRFKFTQTELKNLLKTQAEILDIAASFVRPGGKLSYMTCSLLSPENEEQIQHFLNRHPDFSLLKQKRFSPALTHTDGLFIATCQKSTP